MKYKMRISFVGRIDLEVEAASVEEAEEKADEMLSDGEFAAADEMLSDGEFAADDLVIEDVSDISVAPPEKVV